jgi:hypothetical protein
MGIQLNTCPPMSPPLHPALPAGTLLHPRSRTIWRPTRDLLPYPSRRLSLLSPRSPPSSPQSRRSPSTLGCRSPRPQRLRLALSPHPLTRCAPHNQDSIRGLHAPPRRRLGFSAARCPFSASVSSRSSSLLLSHVVES